MDDLSLSDQPNLLSGRSCLFVDYPEKLTRPDADIPIREGCKIRILSGGGMGQRLSLLAKAVREADNRSLSVTLLCFHHFPKPFGVLLGEEICLLAENPYVLTPDCQVTDLHSLPDSGKLSESMPFLRTVDDQFRRYGESYRLLRSAYLSLNALECQALEPYLLTDKLDAFALRLVRKLKPAREPLPVRSDLCTSTPVNGGAYRSPDPILSAKVRISVSERPPIAHRILSALTGQLTALGISFVRYTDFCGKVYGILIPSIDTYVGLGCPTDRIDRLLNASRFVRAEIREIRPLLRALRQQKDEIAGQIDGLRKKIAGLWQKSDEIYLSVTDREVFSRFEKDFLIDLFQK
ncbi:MAG: hypothetical protein ACI3YK_06830 [Eubacteriales bacterium]